MYMSVKNVGEHEWCQACGDPKMPEIIPTINVSDWQETEPQKGLFPKMLYIIDREAKRKIRDNIVRILIK